MFNYSFKPAMEEKLRLFSKYGFEYIHWCDDWNNNVLYTEYDLEHYRQLIELAGLKCIDVHGAATDNIRIDAADEKWLKEYIRLLENRIRFCAEVGGDAVIIHPPEDEKRGDNDINLKMNRSLYVFEKVRRVCEDLGINIAVENCSKSDEDVLVFYFEKYPPEFVGFCFDSGHANILKSLDQLLKFGNRLRALHLHDNRGESDDHQPPFWGTVDWNKVTQWIKASGYKKPINFEITHNPKHFNGTMEEFLNYTVNQIQKLTILFD